MFEARKFTLVSLLMAPICVSASAFVGASFSHNDWQLVCDNTRTCRAAGYQSEGDEMSVSVLLTRKAGPNQPVTGQLMIGQYGENEALNKLPKKFKLVMRINGKSVGQVVVGKETLVVDLSQAQVGALLVALPRASTIEWAVGDAASWQLSDKGAAAVLLKMDEFQGRIGTQGALVKKGPLGDDNVLPALPLPVVVAAAVAKPLPSDAHFANKFAPALIKALRSTVKADAAGDYCPTLLEPDAGEPTLSVSRLSGSKLLLSTPCWSGAYNFGEGYWVINHTQPFEPRLVTTSASDFADGSISAAQKGRGLGDCWSNDTWTWDGKEFVHTTSATTGMCKLLAPGGAWSLPTIVTDVRPSGR